MSEHYQLIMIIAAVATSSFGVARYMSASNKALSDKLAGIADVTKVSDMRIREVLVPRLEKIEKRLDEHEIKIERLEKPDK